MSGPQLHQVADETAWRALVGAPAERTFVVYTPSMAAHVHRIFPHVPAQARVAISREPHVEDFATRCEGAERAEVVVGIGGGRALDAAKVIAHWGRAFSSERDLAALLSSGGRVADAARARLILAPSLASSGSESSRGAIVTVGAQKVGLRGPSVEPDLVVHDPALWSTLSPAMRAHFAFDVLAHLVETTSSKRGTAETRAHAREGSREFWTWWRHGRQDAHGYEAAMRAAFHAGRCLATSSTCLPHRIQYVLGPATGTAHVHGIWALFPAWFELLAKTAPAEAEGVSFLLAPVRCCGAAEFVRSFLRPAHKSADPGQSIRLTAADIDRLVPQVTGDLAADPAFSAPASIEFVLRSLFHDQ